jgi:hypothetical protein
MAYVVEALNHRSFYVIPIDMLQWSAGTNWPLYVLWNTEFVKALQIEQVTCKKYERSSYMTCVLSE